MLLDRRCRITLSNSIFCEFARKGVVVGFCFGGRLVVVWLWRGAFRCLYRGDLVFVSQIPKFSTSQIPKITNSFFSNCPLRKFPKAKNCKLSTHNSNSQVGKLWICAIRAFFGGWRNSPLPKVAHSINSTIPEFPNSLAIWKMGT